MQSNPECASVMIFEFAKSDKAVVPTTHFTTDLWHLHFCIRLMSFSKAFPHGSPLDTDSFCSIFGFEIHPGYVAALIRSANKGLQSARLKSTSLKSFETYENR